MNDFISNIYPDIGNFYKKQSMPFALQKMYYYSQNISTIEIIILEKVKGDSKEYQSVDCNQY